MMKAVRLSDVLELPVSERLALVGEIWDSIAAAPDGLELTAEQRTELDSRIEAYRQDPTAGSPWAEVKARIIGSR
jgi:putative addiction module component (TIGR02574 family)